MARLIFIPYLTYSPSTLTVKGVNTVKEAFTLCPWARSVERRKINGVEVFEVSDRLPEGYKKRRTPVKCFSIPCEIKDLEC